MATHRHLATASRGMVALALGALLAFAGCRKSARPQPGGGSKSASGTSVTLAVIGDIAEEGRTAHARAVAALISSHTPVVTGLILGGDNARYDGSGTLLEYYTNFYAPPNEANFGQFDSIAYPQLGNHEYGEADARGYFGYFATRMKAIAALPTYHGSIDSVGRGWYSVDLAGWHIVSLNSNCDAIAGACSAGGAQDVWLSGDLAQHAGMPLIAVWHSPRWTCSVGGHDSDSVMQNFWARLYAAHADFVFAGHNHFYQRYRPLGASASATDDPAAGITEIVVGSGGVSTYDVCPASADPQVAKALGGDASIGVLFLTLASDGGYSWEYRVKSDGSVFDSGAGRSHNSR
jgi:hypothetical protein